MKTLLLGISGLLFMAMSCKDNAVTPAAIPAHALQGEWTWTETLYPMTQAKDTPAKTGHTESLTVDATTFVTYKDGKETARESIVVATDAKPTSTTGITGKVTFNGKEYSTYWVSNDGKTMSLYQRAPLGAMLADGGTATYTKK
jgi:hypothetical protein